MDRIRNILLVCTGNTCRSPMAEVILRQILQEMGEPWSSIQVSSAGLSAGFPEGASEHAAKVVEEWGMDLGEHKSRQLTAELASRADLILTMTRGHKEAVLGFLPSGKGKVFTLKEFGDGREEEGDMNRFDYGLDIPDPYGLDVEGYRKCAGEIKAALIKVAQRIKNRQE